MPQRVASFRRGVSERKLSQLAELILGVTTAVTHENHL